MGVTTLASVLILLVVLRAVPGMGMIFKPDTHSNLWEEPKPGYDRTALAYLGDQGDVPPVVAAALSRAPQGLTTEEHGQWLFAGVGCALCHGLDAQGGAVGPRLAGVNPQMVQAMIRFGPGGMPVYSEAELSQEDADHLAAYLTTLEPSTGVTWVSPASDSATPPPIATSAPAASIPNGDPDTVAPSPGDIAAGQALYTSQGCIFCHGETAQGGVGPQLTGLTQDLVVERVRNGGKTMPAFPQDKVSEGDLATIVSYLRSLEDPDL